MTQQKYTFNGNEWKLRYTRYSSFNSIFFIKQDLRVLVQFSILKQIKYVVLYYYKFCKTIN